MDKSRRSDKQDHGHANATKNIIAVGAIGYTFRKFFPGHGTFDGVVVSIRDTFGLGGNTRHCVYVDGDDEDIELSHLRTLPRSKLTMEQILGRRYKQHRYGASKDVKDKVNSSNSNHKKIKQPKKKPRDAANKKATRDETLFSPHDEHVPIDEVAEATLIHEKEKTPSHRKLTKNKSADEENSNDEDAWLENVASILASGGKNRLTSSRSKSNVTTCDEKETISSVVFSKSKKKSSAKKTERIHEKVSLSRKRNFDAHEIDLVALLEVPVGSRHGKKVFYVKDPKRIVGEIILEHSHGRIEAIIDNCLVKGRSNLFVLAPIFSNIGDRVNLSLPLPKRICKHGISFSTSNKALKEKGGLKTEVKEQPVSKHPIHVLATPSVQPLIPSQTLEAKTTSPQSGRSQLNDTCTSCTGNEKHLPKIPLENIFYWSCEKCTMNNSFTRLRCKCCASRKSANGKKSALLEIVENATSIANNVDEALKIISTEHQSTIPISVVSTVMKVEGSSPPYEMPIQKFFKWSCNKCTTINTYTDKKCTVCDRFRTFKSKSSVLFEIAQDAANSAFSVKDAMASIPTIHHMSIPESVLETLMTCSEMIGRTSQDKRRCARPRAEGMNFCSLHCDPHNTTGIKSDYLLKSTSYGDDDNSKRSNITGTRSHSRNGSFSSNSSNIDPTPCLTSPLREENHETLIRNIEDFLLKHVSTSCNHRNWKIASAEDAIFAQEKSLFPLGMLVRRFFPRYGFHDGWISLIQRKILVEEGKRTSRPVLVYRVKYQDGDEEDFMHHEINSLRQIYDIRNIPSTALASSQVPVNTIYECHNQNTIKIKKNIPLSGSRSTKAGGRVVVSVSKNGGAWTETELELTELQLNVIRKVGKNETENYEISSKQSLKLKSHNSDEKYDSPSSLSFKPNQAFVPIVLEWPTGASSLLTAESKPESADKNMLKTTDDKNASKSNGKREWALSPGLWIGLEEYNDSPIEVEEQPTISSIEDDDDDVIFVNDSSVVRQNLSRPSKWDPANISNHLSWDPYKAVVCKICHTDENDHQILICDRCHQGYHMYCLRPIIVAVPTDEWHCPKCSGEDSTEHFKAIMENLLKTPHLVTKFLGLPFRHPRVFHTRHKKEIDIFGPNGNASKRQSVMGTSRSRATVKVGSLSFRCNPQKNDWLLPLPSSSASLYELSLTSMVAAMRHCGMNAYSEDLVYVPNVTEEMNDATLDKVAPMSRRNIEIFKEFKENLKNGAFPPIKIVFHTKIGFTVEALSAIPRHTLIAEYIGEVTTIERSGETSSDSLMILLDTGDPQTSLVIDPTRIGNTARFFSGINNLSNISKRKANVRTRRFELDGRCRVALFTAKRVEPSDQLYYDYNAGMKGKDVVDWAKNGFYDTRNFY